MRDETQERRLEAPACLVHGTKACYVSSTFEACLKPGKEVGTSLSTTAQLAPMLIFDQRNQAPGRSLEGDGDAMIILSKSRVASAIEEGTLTMHLMSNGVICTSGAVPLELIQKIVSYAHEGRSYVIYDRKLSATPITGMLHGTWFRHGMCVGAKQSLMNAQQYRKAEKTDKKATIHAE